MPSKVNEKSKSRPARAQRKCIWIAEQYYKIDLLSGMQRRLSDELPKKTRIVIIYDVRAPFFFCTAAHSSAQTCQDVFCFA